MIGNADTTRENRGKAIANRSNQIKKVDGHQFKVKSQSGKGFYDVRETDNGMTCTCTDFINRGGKCKHILATKYYLEVQQKTPHGIVTEKIRKHLPNSIGRILFRQFLFFIEYPSIMAQDVLSVNISRRM